MSKKIKDQSLFLRTATLNDVAGICALNTKVYGESSDGLSEKMVRSQITTFPEGQFVALFNDVVVGHAATFIIDEEICLKAHSWKEITAGGYASRHDPDGDMLYGMEVCVDPDMRGMRVGERLYNMRKKLCVSLHLKAIVFGGRMPNYAKHAAKGLSAKDYVQAVVSKKLKDPVLGFQMRNGFEPIGVLKNYLPSDQESQGFASHMVWHNSLNAEDKVKQQRGRRSGTVRVSCVQFQVRKVKSFDDFIQQVEYFVDIASGYKADFVVFPELYTLALLSAENKKHTPDEAVRDMTAYTDRYIQAMQGMAISYNINIIGGSHPTFVEDKLKNVCYVFLRDGEVHKQAKIHPTPNERYWWNMEGDNDLNVIQTDCGPIGVLICYDSEFPELARHLADQGALMLFVPFCTDERQGYLRVTYCSQARAIENQVYVATAGVVGNIPDVENMDINYASSQIMTPCDFPFARDGIAAIAAVNTETIIFADLNLGDLLLARKSGSVQNFKDRRFDLYEVNWLK